jgi:nicotinamide-nucleotide amidase
MPPRSTIIATGSELVTGQVADRNGSWLARALGVLGFPAAAILCVPDDARLVRDGIESALGARAKVAVITGGLGPTEDDVTRAAVADFAGVGVALHQGAAAALRAFLGGMRREATAQQLRQATLPAGAEPLPNPAGTAPGFFLDARGLRIVALPGPPEEMQAVAGEDLRGLARALPGSGERAALLRLDTFGMGEADVDARLDGARAVAGVSVGTLASGGTVGIVLAARGPEADALVGRAKAQVLEALGRVVYGEGGVPLPEAFVRLLLDRGLTIATAESCTGGLVGHLLTEVPGVSASYLQGVIAYSNAAKTALLGVPGELIRGKGAVSEETARAMASGAAERAGADLGIGITGIAGPSGAEQGKPVGLVWVAADLRGRVESRRLDLGTMPRSWIKRRSALSAIDLARRMVLSPSGSPA